MLSAADIERIVERKATPDSPVLSVYLDIDQSKASNLNRGFEVSLRELLRSIATELEEEQLQSFSADRERAQQFVSALQPAGKSLILFCDASENLVWAREINAAVQNSARWRKRPYVLPLLEA